MGNSDPIVITAQSMVSSLGLDADTCAAAARAGIRRAQDLDYFRFNSPEDRSVECAIGHPVPVLTNGFEGLARLRQLLVGAMRGLLLPEAASGEIKVYIGRSDMRRLSTGSALIDDRKRRAVFIESSGEQLPAEDRFLSIVNDGVAAAEWKNVTTVPAIISSGHASFSEALGNAVADLNSESCRFAVVGAVDSLVDERSLWWLRSIGRLKSQSNPVGLEPGEGGAVFLVEKESTAMRRGVRPLSRVTAIACTEEPRAQIEGEVPLGRALSEAAKQVAKELLSTSAAEPFIVTDHNGEPARAQEFGTVLSRLSGFLPGTVPPWYPAISFGDTSAAAAGIATGIVHAAFRRAYAPSDAAIILSSADGKARSAFGLTRVSS